MLKHGNLPNQNFIYLDVNNLYGWEMSHGFRFLSRDEITALRQEDFCDDDKDGYIYEIDLHYPTRLHDQHDDYPLAPESLVFDRAMYKPTQQSVVLHMYNFHHSHMKVKYSRASQLRSLFTDTDSRAYAVKTENIYEDMVSDAATKYDFSDYPLNHPLYNTSNRKAIGFFKDELNSVPMREFFGLRSKCYAYLCTGKVDRNVLQHERPVEKKTAKGVKRKVKDEHLHFTHYLDALRSFQTFVCKQNRISSTAHTVRTVHQGKVRLTLFDTKRWICEDTIHTHSHGHEDTVEDPMTLVNDSYTACSIVAAIKCLRHDL